MKEMEEEELIANLENHRRQIRAKLDGIREGEADIEWAEQTIVTIAEATQTILILLKVVMNYLYQKNNN